MEADKAEAPAHWIRELAQSDAEIARGETIPASVVHEGVHRALAEYSERLRQSKVEPTRV